MILYITTRKENNLLAKYGLLKDDSHLHTGT